MNTTLLLLCLIVYLSPVMAHYMPIVEGNELIRIADQPINETDRVVTCKFLLDLLEHNKYACFSRDEIFNVSHGKTKNVVYDSVMQMMDINHILDKNNKQYTEKIIEVFTPEDFKNKSIKGIHTISPLGNSTLIDAKFTGFKIGKLHF